MIWVMQVVMESMRMFPVAGAGIGRYADRDIDLGGYHIPKGTEVAVCLHTLHNVPWNFPDPDTFSPERFSDATGSGEPSSSDTPGVQGLLPSWPLLSCQVDMSCIYPCAGHCGQAGQLIRKFHP